MNDDLLSILTGAAEGLENSAKNIANISLAKNELKQKNELFNIQKKKGELDLKEAELSLDPEIVAARKEKFMLDTQMGKLGFKKAELEIKETENKLKKEKEQHETQINIVLPLLHKAMVGGKLPAGFTVKSDGSFSMTGGPVGKNEEGSLESLLSAAPPEKEAPASGEQGEFTPEQESLIEANVQYHGKSREEIVDAMKKRGLLNG